MIQYERGTGVVIWGAMAQLRVPWTAEGWGIFCYLPASFVTFSFAVFVVFCDLIKRGISPNGLEYPGEGKAGGAVSTDSLCHAGAAGFYEGREPPQGAHPDNHQEVGGPLSA